MKREASSVLIVILAALFLVSYPAFAEKSSKARGSIPNGRYLVTIAGCNDCHTKGWMATEAKIPEPEWLAGDITGWSGPWGTTYAPNLRLFIQGLSEDSWVRVAHKLQARPPMPWWALHRMKDGDLRSIYRFIKSLGPAGQPAPSYQPPGQQPRPPYFLFVPPPQ
jgi:mono/diheme cytochrome c family protein